jgi:hypothetical protein
MAIDDGHRFELLSCSKIASEATLEDTNFYLTTLRTYLRKLSLPTILSFLYTASCVVTPLLPLPVRHITPHNKV